MPSSTSVVLRPRSSGEQQATLEPINASSYTCTHTPPPAPAPANGGSQVEFSPAR